MTDGSSTQFKKEWLGEEISVQTHPDSKSQNGMKFSVSLRVLNSQSHLSESSLL